jgi:NhaA family Na+:H+ antiporter
MLLLNRLRVHNLLPYLIGGVVLWYALHHAGIHATIAGVLTAFAIPFGDGDIRSPSYGLQHRLHMPVAFGIMPLFALANAGLVLSPSWTSDLVSPIGLGVLSGLLLGKPLGILMGVLVAQKLMPSVSEIGWRQYAGASVLAGIGFTMSIFITLLAFDDQAHVVTAKTAVFAASLLAGIAGFLLLNKKEEKS